jgi:hypothetical protein
MEDVGTVVPENPPAPSVFRREYRPLSEAEVVLLNEIKDKAQELYDLFPQENGRGKNREISLAMTELETAVMWAVKGITG